MVGSVAFALARLVLVAAAVSRSITCVEINNQHEPIEYTREYFFRQCVSAGHCLLCGERHMQSLAFDFDDASDEAGVELGDIHSEQLTGGQSGFVVFTSSS